MDIINMKRINRQMADIVKKKISQKLKGRKKTEHHREMIAKALKQYWATINTEANKEEDNI